MAFPAQLAWIKRLASLLLLVCLFLPLSKCEGKADPDSGKPAADTIYYGAKLIASGLQEASTSSIGDLGYLLVIIAAFLLPAASLAARGVWEPLTVLVGSAFAGHFLYYWVIAIPHHAMIGGILAIAAWVVLVLVSVSQLLVWRRRRVTPPAPGA